ncbi:MAG TPA: hypothetical protein VIF09_15010 [Polyangiaceae bacterium]|jgi:hypothetical protein
MTARSSPAPAPAPALALALALALSFSPSPALAQDTHRCEARARAIQTTLDLDARRTRVWYWAWMATGTALLAGQAVLAGVTTGDAQKDYIAGAATSVFIPAVLLLHPPAVLSDAPRLDARLDATTAGGHLGDPCVAFSRAVEFLRRDADDEALTTGWFSHTFVIGGNIAVGLLLGIAFHDWWGATKQAVGGSIVGELQILTLPGVALHAQGLGIGGSF